LASSKEIHVVAQLYRHFDATGRLLYVGISLFAFRWLAAHERNAGWWKDVRTVTITPPYRTRAEAAAAEIEAIKNEKPLFNQQHHPAPVEPPIAPAMAGKALLRRLAAAHRHGEVPGDGDGFQARIDNALALLRQDGAGAETGDPPR
jgi:hypothetical protein